MRRRLVGLCLLLLSVACSSGPPSPDAAGSRAVVRLGYQPFLGSAPLFIALDQGFFQDEGLHVETVRVGARESIPALVRGDIDVMAHFVNTGFFAALGKGAPMRVVADKGSPTRDGCAADGLIASPKLAARLVVPESLRGTRIGYSETTFAEYALDQFLAKGGLGRGDYQFVYVSTQNAGAALANGDLDFRLTSEPEISIVKRYKQGTLWLPVSAMADNPQWSEIVFGSRLLADRDTGLRFMRAYLRGVARYNEGKIPANATSVMRHTELDADTVQGACWTQIRSNGRINVDSLMSFQRWAKSRGYIDRVLEPAEFVEPWFVEQISAGGSR